MPESRKINPHKEGWNRGTMEAIITASQEKTTRTKIPTLMMFEYLF